MSGDLSLWQIQGARASLTIAADTMEEKEKGSVVAVCNDCPRWDECLGEHAISCMASIDVK